jgi:hypothetical protein
VEFTFKLAAVTKKKSEIEKDLTDDEKKDIVYEETGLVSDNPKREDKKEKNGQEEQVTIKMIAVWGTSGCCKCCCCCKNR